MAFEYELRHGSYYLQDPDEKPHPITGERTIRLMTDTVALAFDRANGTLHKHGAPEQVEAWANQARQVFRDQGAPDLAEDIVVVAGALPVDEINRCLSHSGYFLTLMQKLQNGALSSAKPVVETPLSSTSSGTGEAQSRSSSAARTNGPSVAVKPRSAFPHRR